jgi:fibronectin type 3 domain-containing protein
VPTAPTIISVTAGNTTLALAWSAPASDGGLAVTSYDIYRGTTSSAETYLTSVGNVTTWTDSTLTNGTTYFYQVRAVNQKGASPLSAERSGTPVGVGTLPSAPQSVGVKPNDAKGIVVTWKAPRTIGSSAIVAYKIYRGTASKGETLLATVGNVLTFTDTAVKNGTTYYYQITAVNGVGESPRTSEKSATRGTAPTAPRSVTATAGTGNVTLKWSSPSSNGGASVTGYRIYRGTTSGGETLLATAGGTATSFVDSTATKGTRFYYYVTAVNPLGESPASIEASAVPL